MDAKDTVGENCTDSPDMPRLRDGLPPGRAKVGHPKDPQKSRLTNAPVLLANVDGRTTVARRYRDIATAIAADQGGADRLSETRLQLIRRFSAAACLAEQLESPIRPCWRRAACATPPSSRQLKRRQAGSDPGEIGGAKCRRHYGAGGDPRILVAHGASRTLNPSLPQRVVDRALEKDRTRATAEYLAEFRTDVEGFVALEVVESCVGDHREMLPAAGVTYRAFVDPSGGSEDAMTLAIAHGSARPDERVIVDAVREVRPPFSPSAVVGDFAVLLKSYRISKVVGDHYGGEFVKEPFRKHGISYEVCKQPKSDLFRDMLPLLNSGHIILPRHDRLIAQIVGLERRVSRAGRDSIDHAPGGHDDIANAVSGVVGAISGVGAFDFEFWHDDRAWNGGAPSSDDLLWFLRARG
jgi:hypothetical protein